MYTDTSTYSDIKNIIEMRRYETFTVHTLMQDFCISDCDWLTLPVPESAKPHKVPISDSLKRLELLQEYLYWYFDSFLIPLLKVCFTLGSVVPADLIASLEDRVLCH